MQVLPYQNPRVCFITLGCAKNEVDSNHMAAQLTKVGFVIIDDPSKADAVIVNTCSFIQAATEESLEAILDVADLESMQTGKAKLIVAGCLPARYGNELEKELPEASAFVPCSREDSIVEVLFRVLELEALPFSSLYGSSSNQDRKTQLKQKGHPSAYLKISDGCNRFCSYCTIPFIRGRYQSFSQAKIFNEVQVLINEGVREIVLIAQDTGRWGSDFEEPSTLAHLLENLADHFPYTWFRIMYLQPDGIDDKLLQTMAVKNNICAYLDIPIQHTDTQILKAMNRSGSYEQIQQLIDHIRAKVPGITLRTTLIAGFPGETEEAFESLCAFVEEADFDYVGVFPYSREEGTKAAAFVQQIDEETKLERAQKLRDIADLRGSAKVAERIGSKLDILVLGHEEDGQLYGRAQCQAPEVDGVTYLKHGAIGDIVSITVNDTLLYEMEGV